MNLQELIDNRYLLAQAVVENNFPAVQQRIREVLSTNVPNIEAAVNVVNNLMLTDDTPAYEKILTVPYVQGRNGELDEVYSEARSFVSGSNGGAKILPVILASLFGVVTTAGNIPGMDVSGIVQQPEPEPETFYSAHKQIIHLAIGGLVLTLLAIAFYKATSK